jgi:hypothetical protein
MRAWEVSVPPPFILALFFVNSKLSFASCGPSSPVICCGTAGAKSISDAGISMFGEVTAFKQ